MDGWINMKNIQDYPYRILLTIAGGSPAIVTETLYALTQTTKESFIPTEIHIITTAGAYQRIVETLLGKNGKVQQLCEDYGLPLPIFPESNIHQIADKEGNKLADITSEADNEITADYITNTVRELTANKNTSLHVSIAGGRKTMTYYLGYAMSVFGRIQDNMSHVLVEDAYLSQDFYYPTPEPKILTTRKGQEFDASKVKVMLGYLPYIRLRDGLTDDLLQDNKQSFSQIIEVAQRQLTPLHIKIINDKLHCSGFSIDLSAASLSLYLWGLQRHQEEESKEKKEISFNTKEQKELNIQQYLAIYKVLSGASEHYIKLEEETFAKFPMDGKYFGEHRSKINKALEEKLGKPAAAVYLIKSKGKRGAMTYFLSQELEPKHIDIDFIRS